MIYSLAVGIATVKQSSTYNFPLKNEDMWIKKSVDNCMDSLSYLVESILFNTKLKTFRHEVVYEL